MTGGAKKKLSLIEVALGARHERVSPGAYREGVNTTNVYHSLGIRMLR